MIPTRILSVPESCVRGTGSVPPLAIDTGIFDALVLEGDHALFDLDDGTVRSWADEASRIGSLLFAQVNLYRFPAEHGLVKSRPEAFLQSTGANPPDPRLTRPPEGEARARLERYDLCGAVVDGLAGRLTELVSWGLSGVVVNEPHSIDPSLLARIVAGSPAGLTILACASERMGDESSIDGYMLRVSTGHAAEQRPLHETIAELGKAKPVLCEIASDAMTDNDFPARQCAALAGGIVVSTGTPEKCGSALDMAKIGAATSGFSPRLHRLVVAGDVTAYLRPEKEDLRVSREALLVIVNDADAPRRFPDQASLAKAAAPFAADLPATDLAPHEVRCIAMTRNKPILDTAKRKAGSGLRDHARIVVEEVSPSVEGGDFPVKRVVGDEVIVEATIFADGHEHLAAELRWRAIDAKTWQSVRMEELPNDRWRASFPLERMGRHEFLVEGWLDRFGGFRRDFSKKLEAGVAQPVDHAEGRVLVEQAQARAKGSTATALKKWAAAIAKAEGEESAKLLLDEELAELMMAADERPHALATAPQKLDAERIEARFSSWYELFPRSMTDDKARHGTFADVIEHLPRVRDMGFDTLYFPPIHPIGKTNRKGPNNTLTPGPDDPGSPYAIGSAEGGHDAIHPELGSFQDFDRLVAAAADHGLEIALDFAIQAAPDHPWLEEHPGWFAWRPDGSMKYAENPPKKYQDIVNVDFYGPDAVPGLWEALRDVILLWVDHGVKTFRVDNPHTKPLPFWEWMIDAVRARHPDVIFLSEAFTRPTMMYRLAKVGFSQSYTYFTWRNEKHELIDYITELTSEAPRDFYRPHFFVNTPDINPEYLQTGGRPAHRIRAVLAATLSGLWGVYSGFELCDATPLGPGKEEYLDSEKYEIRPREWRSDTDIVDDIKRLNELRRAHPALQTHLNTRFYQAHDDAVIWYGKPAPDGSEMIMVMVSLDPHGVHECDFEVPLWEFGLGDDASIAVEDLFGGYRFDWHGKVQHIRLDPDEPFRVWRLSAPGGLA